MTKSARSSGFHAYFTFPRKNLGLLFVFFTIAINRPDVGTFDDMISEIESFESYRCYPGRQKFENMLLHAQSGIAIVSYTR